MKDKITAELRVLTRPRKVLTGLPQPTRNPEEPENHPHRDALRKWITSIAAKGKW
jgi:hypothetical protein